MNKDPQTYEIIGACMEVHRELGGGFLEAVYQEALGVELGAKNIPYQQEVQLPIYYKGKLLNVFYKADFICHGDILVELKAVAALTPKDESQVINYLQATKKKRALLVNFGGPSLEYKRFVL
jgi:GxxExxY protein